ncbi:hypothetical protein LX32DRAFT_6518 [Colletotrichum zoysiae]|uniref:Uncharacterized protein n=1 Tax=Colletotrichum zoysiae TaxID=1216348 RepID=A0AAD9HRU9_9PEZI|nr:hypothetical protein LX32DRAFT_6518 [Colletotrichum zoysiae]
MLAQKQMKRPSSLPGLYTTHHVSNSLFEAVTWVNRICCEVWFTATGNRFDEPASAEGRTGPTRRAEAAAAAKEKGNGGEANHPAFDVRHRRGPTDALPFQAGFMARLSPHFQSIDCESAQDNHDPQNNRSGCAKRKKRKYKPWLFLLLLHFPIRCYTHSSELPPFYPHVYHAHMRC